MSEEATVGELFELAIAAEKTAEKLYRGLGARFAHHEEVADFWRSYAAEEAGHAKWLKRLREGLDAGRLSAPADPVTLENARQVLQFSVENTLQEIENLEDAYQLANELENSETSAIFEFLITNFSSDEETQSFLRAQLRDHVARLMIDLPTQFKSVVVRRGIKASKP